MRTLLLLAISIAAGAVDSTPKVTTSYPEHPFDEANGPSRTALQVTDNDLQNLVACARMALQSLTPEQISAVAVAIKHAEDDITAMRKAKAVEVTASPEPAKAAPKP